MKDQTSKVIMTNKTGPMITTKEIIWLVFFALLAVLLPHTAWWFQQFEPASPTLVFDVPVPTGALTAWLAALAFEASIATFTHKLSKHIESVPNYTDLWKRRRARYLNVYSLGLLAVLAVSTTANYTHAVQFGQPVAAFARAGVPVEVYAIVAGAILPFCSILFAWLLSDVQDAETEVNPDVERAKSELAESKKQLRMSEAARAESEAKRTEAEQALAVSEQRFAAAGDLLIKLFTADKRQRILTAAQQWPELPAASIAVIAEASPGYVSQVLNESKAEVG